MENLFPGFFGIDLDGTLIDSDSDKLNSPNYSESLAIIREKTGILSLNLDQFNEFFQEFAKQSYGLSLRLSSGLFTELILKQYNISVNPTDFNEYRTAMRQKTYAESVRFIGDGNSNGSSWLAELAQEFKNELVLVTSASMEALPYIKSNPHLKINGLTLDEFFGNRIVFGDRVLATGEPIQNRKPCPECYEKGIALTNSENHQGLVGIAFEDGKNGIISAKNARFNDGRLFVVGIGTTLTPAEAKEAGADYFAPALHAVKLPELLRAYSGCRR
jgi:hypothetical protein